MPAKPNAAPIPAAEPDPDYDPEAIFRLDGPLHPEFVSDAVRNLVRTLPVDPGESPVYVNRRIFAALRAVAALHPRDEIEMMLAVQAVAAYYAACAGWRLAMNHHRPNGDSTRHAAMAASATRTFDSLLKALERRQAKPLSVPAGRPPGQNWVEQDLALFTEALAERCRAEAAAPMEPARRVVWTPDALQRAAALREQEGQQDGPQDGGEDPDADIESILPGGIIPEDPSPAQQAFIGRRIGLVVRHQHEQNQRRGIHEALRIPPLRAGDRLPGLPPATGLEPDDRRRDRQGSGSREQTSG